MDKYGSTRNQICCQFLCCQTISILLYRYIDNNKVCTNTNILLVKFILFSWTSCPSISSFLQHEKKEENWKVQKV